MRKGSWFLLLLLVWACSGGGSDGGGADTLPGADTSADDVVAEDGLVPLDTGGDSLAPEDTSPRPEDAVQLDTPEPPPCPEPPEPPVCENLSAAPTTPNGQKGFVEANAVSLICSDGGNPQWDFRVYEEEFGDGLIFLTGEVHGSKEIGPYSAALFEHLVYTKGINTLVLEVGMDTTDAMNDYVQTGDDGPGSALSNAGWDMYTDYMFRRTTLDAARELNEKGIEVEILGIDSPQRLAWVNEQLEAYADQAGDAAAVAVLLDTLPAKKEMNQYGMMGLPTTYVKQCETYYTHVWNNLNTVCVNFDDETCEDVKFMAYALYIGAAFNSQDFMMGGMGGGDRGQLMAWMEEREDLLYHNFKRVMEVEGAKVYGHFGAAHATKIGWNVAKMMDQDFEPTMGRVYSTTPAYGPGSKIFYGIMAQDVPPEPDLLADHLPSMPSANYFFSTDNPGAGCIKNPLATAVSPRLMVSYGLGWDAFTWFRVLTPDTPEGGWFKPTRHQPWSSPFTDPAFRAAAADEWMRQHH